MSAPPTYGHRKCLDDIAYRTFPETPRHHQTLEAVIGKRESVKPVSKEGKLPKLAVVSSAKSKRSVDIDDDLVDEDNPSPRETNEDKKETVTIEEIKPITESKPSFYQKTGVNNLSVLRPHSEMSSLKSRTGSRMKNDRTRYESNSKNISEKRKTVGRKAELPPFVQVEVLHPGQSFVCTEMTWVNFGTIAVKNMIHV